MVQEFNLVKPVAVSIIIPVLNEEKRIRPTINKIINYFVSRKMEYEIIFVDDGSTDNTLSVVMEEAQSIPDRVHYLHNKKNRGKGFSVKRGMMFARGDVLLFTDADLSTPIGEYALLESAIEKDGFENPSQNEDIKNKKQLTSIINFGVPYALQNKDIH